jgi:hypothetical protein
VAGDFPSNVEASASASPVPARASFSRMIGRHFLFGLVWVLFLSQAFMVVAFASTAKKPPTPLILAFSFLGGTLLAMHTKRFGILWFFVGAIASFFLAATLLAASRATG